MLGRNCLINVSLDGLLHIQQGPKIAFYTVKRGGAKKDCCIHISEIPAHQKIVCKHLQRSVNKSLQNQVTRIERAACNYDT